MSEKSIGLLQAERRAERGEKLTGEDLAEIMVQYLRTVGEPRMLSEIMRATAMRYEDAVLALSHAEDRVWWGQDGYFLTEAAQ